MRGKALGGHSKGCVDVMFPMAVERNSSSSLLPHTNMESETASNVKEVKYSSSPFIKHHFIPFV